MHPFGYGRELYFWSFVVAVLVFALGAGVSVYEGVIHILEPEHAVSPLIAYGVLLVAFLLEGGSTFAAFKDFRAAKGGLGWFQAVRISKDPPAFIVLLENGAAMAGILVAAIGLALSQLTGNPFFDGAASVVIGLILGVTALVLADRIQGAADRRIGRSRPRPGHIRDAAERQPGIVGVGHVLTVHSAPDQITVVMSADFDDTITAGAVERIIADIEAEVEAHVARGQAPLHPPAAGGGPEPNERPACRGTGAPDNFGGHEGGAMMRILIALAATAALASAAAAANAPQTSWGKAGVSFDDYRSDATFCLREAAGLDLTGTEPANALVLASRRMATGQTNDYSPTVGGASGTGAADHQ